MAESDSDAKAPPPEARPITAPPPPEGRPITAPPPPSVINVEGAPPAVDIAVEGSGSPVVETAANTAPAAVAASEQPSALDVAAPAEVVAPYVAIDDAPPSNSTPKIETTSATEVDEPAPTSKRPPGISNLRPSKASSEGGTQVALFGAGFQEGCRVWIANVALETEWVDGFCVRFTAPAHPVGFAHIDVENPDGLRSRSIVELAFERGPVIGVVRPEEVPLEGGIEIVVEGDGFEEGCTISLFGVHAPIARLESAKVLRFTAPPVTTGPYEGALSITNPDGLSGRIEHSIIYRALAPSIDALDPPRGWVNGGKLIEVRGADFHATCVVRFGDRPAEVRFKSPKLLEVVVPSAEAAGSSDVTIQNPDGTSVTLASGFVYEPIPAPPKIINVVPSSGSIVGGLIVRVAGDNFTEATKIRFGDVTAVTRFLSPKVIEAELPPRASPGKVAVEAADAGINIRVEDAFTYFSPNAPKVTGMDPPSGPATGGTKVVIEGESFPRNATVRIGREAPKHVVIKDATRIEIVTPASKTAGFVDVEVSSVDTGPGVLKNGFRYDAVPAPSIVSVAPNRGATSGGTELTVEGKNFVEGLTVTIGKKPAKRVKRISGSILEVITPEGDDGDMVDVVVKNPDGKDAVQKRAFLYDARYRG